MKKYDVAINLKDDLFWRNILSKQIREKLPPCKEGISQGIVKIFFSSISEEDFWRVKDFIEENICSRGIPHAVIFLDRSTGGFKQKSLRVGATNGIPREAIAKVINIAPVGAYDCFIYNRISI